MSSVKDIDTKDFQEQVVDRSHEVPVIVDFWAEWCGPCRVLGPTLERLTDEAGGTFELAKVDVDANQSLSSQFGIQGIPTVVAFKDGQLVSQFTGALPESQIRNWLAGFIPHPMAETVAAAEKLLQEGNTTEAAELFSQVLASDPLHEDSAVSLATILIENGEPEAALGVLAGLPSTPQVERTRAQARMTASTALSVEDLKHQLMAEQNNDALRLDLARALVAEARVDEGLDVMLEIVADRGDAKEEARTAMLDVFEAIGSEHPLSVDYRRRLANALF